ncbi:MAG: Na(+)/H(+) antiporter NhaD [Pseudomonadota bacterium]|jgi:Na+/H+ antiporter NhaD/arsenite permease-like protein
MMVAVFIVGYLCIALEHPLRVNKAATALLLGTLVWVVYVLGDFSQVSVPEWWQTAHGTTDGVHPLLGYQVDGQLLHLTGEIAGLLFFLIGAMTIVELVDQHEGFALVTARIKTTNPVSMLWLIGFLTFFMSSVLDNLTTTIVMVSLLRRLVRDQKARWIFVGAVVIAANAGGAWTVIGDVTTTMLWVRGKLDPLNIMRVLFVPSLICLVVPLVGLSFRLKGTSLAGTEEGAARGPEVSEQGVPTELWRQRLFLALGVTGLISVPVFKAVTHLPPFMGVLLSLGVMWVATEIVNTQVEEHVRTSTGVSAALRKVDFGSVLFFLGILLAVGALGASGLLGKLALELDETIGNQSIIALVIGLVSAVVDNVPLVAAGIDMYSYPRGHSFWSLLAYCAGTGGSCLIIGSAAGVAAMGLENISFGRYLKDTAGWALVGYLAGFGYLML